MVSLVSLVEIAFGNKTLPDADKRLRSSPIVESSAGSPYEIGHLTVAEVREV